MHKKVSVIAISILLILNFIVVKMYVKNKDSKINGIQKVYILQGKNQNWSVENYKIIISFHEFKTGWGEVHIIADKNDFNINDLTVYQLDIIKVDKVNSEKKEVKNKSAEGDDREN